jgi:hypothetical protein
MGEPPEYFLDGVDDLATSLLYYKLQAVILIDVDQACSMIVRGWSCCTRMSLLENSLMRSRFDYEREECPLSAQREPHPVLRKTS